ncbi:MAG: ABC-2 type transport system ATP-binding protein [Candidatus Binatia bacterium]
MSVLRVEEISRRFGDLQAVDRVSFTVEPGEIYGLLGPNGAGKTTSISMTCGLLRPDSGRVFVEELEFWRNPEVAQKRIGVVPQDIALYDELSGRENLIFWGRLAGVKESEIKAKADEMLERLTLSDRGGDLIKKYSGGMKRRINIGCALMHAPRLVLLDEPTVGIDPQARASILEFVKGLTAAGTAVLYTTHYLEEAEELCDRIGIIDQGKILAEGTLAELQGKLGSDQLFILEGDFKGHDPDALADLNARFKQIQVNERQWIVSSTTESHPSESLKALLDLPIPIDNVTFKKPNLNDVFLQLTGRDLRE